MDRNQLVEKIAEAIMSEVFGLAQPNRGDVFSWLDDHSKQVATAALTTAEAHIRETVEAEIVAYLKKSALAIFGSDPALIGHIKAALETYADHIEFGAHRPTPDHQP